ncbi:MAG: hypothetical protein HYZ34_01390 [Ignavibacteriae bacterium]|nr:hypothetical protein [Ignavibacteriota bacterium]
MRFRIEPHTLEQMVKRGTNQDEIIQVMNTEKVEHVKQGRLKKSKVFPFNNFWCDKYYLQKKVEVIYTVEQDEAVTVTVSVVSNS